MNNIKDINIKIYSRDDLQSAKVSVIKEIMNDYSIKANGRLKKDMIEAIIQYQDNVSKLRHKIEDDSHSIDNYHRGTVSYSLPTIIIYRIIRDLWHHEILETKYTLSPSLKDIKEKQQQIKQLLTFITENPTRVKRVPYQTEEDEEHEPMGENDSETDNLAHGSNSNRSLKKSYQWLLSLAVLSKEFFKLISMSLFTSIKLAKEKYPDKDLMLKTIIMNPYSVMKNITTFSVTTNVLNKISSMNKPAELKLIFGSVERLMIQGNGDKINLKTFGLIGNAMSKLQHLQIATSSIDTPKIQEIIQKNFHSIISLDLSMSNFDDITFDMNLLPPNLSILYLPEESEPFMIQVISKKSRLKLESYSHKFTEIGILPRHMYITKILTEHLKKLYIKLDKFAYGRSSPDELFKFISSDRCNLTKLTFNFIILRGIFTRYDELIKLLNSVNGSKISTFKLICHNFDDQLHIQQPDTMNILFNLIVPIENIKWLVLGFKGTNYLSEHLTHTANNVQPTGFIVTRNNRITTDEYHSDNLYHLKRIDLSNTNTTDGTYEIISYNPIPCEIEELTKSINLFPISV